MLETLNVWDTWLFYTLHHYRNQFFDVIMPLISHSMLPWILGALLFLFWIVRFVAYPEKRQARARFMLYGVLLLALTSGITEATHHAVKYGVRRPRPGYALPDMYHMSKEGLRYNSPDFRQIRFIGDSFFSGHAAHSTALAVTAVTLCPPLGPSLYILPALIGYSRIYLGRHYPGDIVAGWLVGAGIALAMRRATRPLREKLRIESTGDRC